MSSTTFDPRRINALGVDTFIGEVTKCQVVQGPPVGEVNNLVINRSEVFTIELEWQFDGVLGEVNEVLATQREPRKFSIDVYAERMGPGNDLLIYSSEQPFTWPAGALPAQYNHSCSIPANTLPEHIPGTRSGVYKLVVCIFSNTTAPGCTDISGFYEGPIIQSEDPV